MPSLRIPSLDIFRHRQFAQYWAMRCFGTLAVQIQATAMGWQVYDAARAHGQTIAEGAFMLGLVGLAQFLPLLVFSLFGGQAADRYNRRGILIACMIAKSAIMAWLIFASGLGPEVIIPAVFAAAVSAGIINAFMPPAASALLPMLVPRKELPQGIALTSLAFQSSMIIGPVAGGFLYDASVSAPYIAAFVLLLGAILLLVTLKAPPQESVKDARTLSMIAEGLRYVWSNKIVLGAISLDLVVVLLAGAVALLPVFTRDILHAGPGELGVLRSAMGVGAAGVALWLAMNPLRAHVGVWMFGATIAFGLATIVFGLSKLIWLSALALGIANAVDQISVYVRSTLIQLNTPDPMRGRVSAVSFVFISASNELGDFEAGLMARIFGPVMAVTLGGAASIVASAWWIRLFPALAKADSFEPQSLSPEAQNAIQLNQETEKT